MITPKVSKSSLGPKQISHQYFETKRDRAVVNTGRRYRLITEKDRNGNRQEHVVSVPSGRYGLLSLRPGIGVRSIAMSVSVCLSVRSHSNKRSEVAEMGDRFFTIDMGRKVGGCCATVHGGAGSPSNTMSPVPRPTSVPTGILIHPGVWPQCTNVADRQDKQRSDSIGRPCYKRSPKNRTSKLHKVFCAC